MPEYQKMYVQLFAAVTDALEAMSQENYVGLFFRRVSV